MAAVKAQRSFFADESFLDQLTRLLTVDAKALHEVRGMLEANDFKPLAGMQWGNQRWIVADRAMQYHDRFHQPVGQLLQADLMEYASSIQLNERQVDMLDSYIEHLAKLKPVNPSSIIEKVTTFKLQHIKADVIQELSMLHSAGELTDAKWMELFRRGVPKLSQSKAVDYFATLDSRIDKRSLKWQYGQNPIFFIEPLDDILNPHLGPKQLGLIIAPTNRGKSLFLLWIAAIYALQGVRTLYITLEDAMEEVETRLDSAITKIPFLELEKEPAELRRRFAAYKRLVTGGLRIIDGTEEKYTVAMIERAVLDQRGQGFLPQALIVDYDDYLTDPAMRDRRQEIDKIYRDLKILGAQYNLFTWTAAQTQRNTSHMKVLSGDKVAEDIGKIRKCTIAISMGRGEALGEGSFYLWVAKHKFGRSQIGCDIIPDLETQAIYDHEATRKALHAVAASDDTQPENAEEEELGE